MTAWFGEPWPTQAVRATVCEDDDERVDTPVGEVCLDCGEPVLDGDRGIMLTMVGLEVTGGLLGTVKPAVRRVPMHIECQVRDGLGGPAHLLGRCTCQGGDLDPDMGMTRREAAKYVWDNLMRQGSAQWS